IQDWDSKPNYLLDKAKANLAAGLQYSYRWSPTNSLDNPNSPSPTAFPTETTTYSVTVTDSEDFCQIERELTIVVPEAIQLLLPPDQAICEEEIELIASSPQATGYTWAADPDFMMLLSDSNRVTVMPNGLETYYIEVVDFADCSLVDSIQINGQSVNTLVQDVVLVCEGDTASLLIQNLDPLDTLSHLWSPGASILTAVDSSEVLAFINTPGTYTFYINSENQFNCTRLDSLTLGVLDTSAQLDFVFSQQCSGFSVQFNNTSINAPYYQWDFGDPSQPGAISNEENPSFAYSAPGVYEVTLTTPLPCTDPIVKQVEVIAPAIEVDFEYNFESCEDSIVIDFMDLSTNSQSNFTDWTWFFSNGQQSNEQNPSIAVLENQILEVMLTIDSDDGCRDTAITEIEIVLIDVVLQDQVEICLGSSVPLNPNPNTAYQYEWFPATGLDDPNSPNPMASPTESTSYTAMITNFGADTCQVMRSIDVELYPEIDLLVSPDEDICEEEALIFAQSDLAESYLWSEDPTFATVFSTDPEVVVQPERPSIYYVQVVDTFGCSKTEDIVLNGYRPDVAVAGEAICVSDTVQLVSTNLIEEDVLTYAWSPESSLIDPADIPDPLATPLANTTYNLVVTNQFGCTDSEILDIEVFDFQPPLSIFLESDTIVEGQTITLEATESEDYTYSWAPAAEVSDPTIYNPTATPLETTDYAVSIVDASGCRNEAQVRVVVLNPLCEPPFIFVPTAFTPNDDGENDFVQVFGTSIDEVYFAIYNRWGQKVFETRDKDQAWDGRFEGQLLNSDVFGYYLEVLCIGGDEYVQKGNITLIR
ncbi:MAG: PKD domain-containing protein, partial [Bacteroidota bacterium]